MSVRATIKRAFGHDAFDWFDRLYFVDWAVVVLIWILSWAVSFTPVFQQTFSPEDPGISHPHRKNTVGSQFNHWTALLVPAVVFTFGGLLRASLLIAHHGIISVCAARGLARLITEALKHSAGCVLISCLVANGTAYSKPVLGTVTPILIELLSMARRTLSEIINGRKSFPSGHSSTAFSGMTLLSLWLAGQTGAWCFGAPCTSSPIRSRLASLFLTLLPLFWAGFVAVTRIEDNRHHSEDVVVGSMIGILSSMICYHVFWPSPFLASNFDQDVFGQPRLLYSSGVWVDSQAPAFRLARLEEDDTENV